MLPGFKAFSARIFASQKVETKGSDTGARPSGDILPTHLGKKEEDNQREQDDNPPRRRRESSVSTDTIERTSARIARQYSASSSQALAKLKAIEGRLREFDAEYHQLQAQLDSACLDILATVKAQLALLNGGIEKLQVHGIDSIITTNLISGKDDVKVFRRRLNAKTTKLIERITLCHLQCAERMRAKFEEDQLEKTRFVLM